MNSEWPLPPGGWDIASLTELFASDPEELGDVDVSVEVGRVAHHFEGTRRP